MNNKIEMFWRKRAQMNDQYTSARLYNDERLNYDLKLIKGYLTNASYVLDLGCGSCIITNEIESIVQHITAVDKYGDFFRFCIKSNKIKTIQADIVDFKIQQEYDLILIFGVNNYITAQQAQNVYNNCFNMLKNNGILIVKHQMGEVEDVFVDNYSDDLECWYTAEYRSVSNEKTMLEQAGFIVEVKDIYPPEMNRWENTHFYALIGAKPNKFK